jgi:phage-related protein
VYGTLCSERMGMSGASKRVPASFYQSERGNEPVREWLWGLSAIDRQLIGRDIAVVEYGWPVGMPTCRPLGKGLWEVRSDVSNGRVARVIFCIAEGRMVLLHGFIKKQRQTPASDLALAQDRQKEINR